MDEDRLYAMVKRTTTLRGTISAWQKAAAAVRSVDAALAERMRGHADYEAYHKQSHLSLEMNGHDLATLAACGVRFWDE